jgi:acetyl esterase/lipase
MKVVALLLALFAVPQDEILFEKDVVYGTGGGEELKLNIGRPRELSAPTPCIVIIHGGGWAAGNKNGHDAQVRELAKKGYVAATVAYRFAPKHIFPAQIEDVKCGGSCARTPRSTRSTRTASARSASPPAPTCR